ncbi:MAG: TIGR03086 family metal-binding protein [Acidimicrobiales bacterium]
MDVLDLDRRAASGLAALIEATSKDQFDGPTPCPAWSVRDLLAHIVAGNLKYTEIAHGRDWSRGAPEVDLGDDPAGMYRQTHETMLRAWSQPGVLERETPLPVGRGPAAAALHLHVGEALVHGWDLASATGQAPVFNEDVVEACLAQFRGWLPPQRPPGSPFSDATAVGDGATPIDRLAAYLGRDVRVWSG